MSHDEIKPRGRKEREISAKIAEEKKRGSFVIRLHTGKRIRFKDADHRGAAWGALSSRTFSNTLELVEYASSLPNGFTSFISIENQNNQIQL